MMWPDLDARKERPKERRSNATRLPDLDAATDDQDWTRGWYFCSPLRLENPRHSRLKKAIGKVPYHNKLNPDPLDLIERDFVTGPVIELSRARRLVICDRLRRLQRAAVEQVRRDSGRAPRVAANIDAEARGQGAPADHPVDVGLRQLITRGLSVSDGLKQRRFLFVPQTRSVDIFLGRVMRRDLM